MKKILLTIVIVTISLIQVSAQCMLSPVLLPQRIQNSSTIIEGKVINQMSFWDPAHANIYTSNLIEVYKTFKNSSPAYVEIITEGGTVGNDKEEVHPSLELSIGDIGIFTLNTNNLPSQYGKPVFEAYASSQGFIRYNVAENEGNEPFKKYVNLSTSLYSEIQLSTQTNYSIVKPINPFATSNVNTTQAVAAITGFSPSTITAGTFSVVTINGSGFGTTQGTSFVEFKRADDGGATFCRPDAWSYLLWSDTQIQVRLTTTGAGTVNSTPGSGVIRVDVGGVKTTSTASITVTHAQMNVYSNGSAPTTIYNTRHVNKQSGGYVWQMYTGFDSNTAAKASFLRAFQSWRCGTYINWTAGATTTVNTIANDGVNVIRFDVGTELPSGVLGRCTSRFSGCGTQPNQNWFVNELDIVFDDGTTWNYGPAAPTFSQYDFESVAVHELGHGHQLGHVINSAEIMNYSIANGQSKRVLSVNDLAGGNAVMTRNLTGGVCAISAMTALTASNCTIGAPTASFTANRTTVCPGQAVIFTNLSTGSPTLNTWTFAGGTPSTSTVSSPTVTYNTPGTYSVQLVVSNANGSSTYSVASYINVTSAATLPLSQTFQTATFPPTNWYIEDAGNDNVKWKLATNAGFSSTQSTVFDNWTDSITPYKDELKTYVNLTGFSTAKMTFYRSYSQTFAAPYVDTLQIGVSTNCGTSTVYPYLKGGSQLATATTSSSAAPFTPTATTQWVKDSIDLTPYVGQSNVMVAFINRGHYGDAIYLDNINITGVAASTPTAAISSASVGCTGTPITLTDASTGGPSSWSWTMAGGTPSVATTQNTSVTYSTAGVKTITLTVANGSGTTTATKSITITATPTVAASITNTTICSGNSVTETLTGATTYTWLPTGSGSTSTLTPASTTIYTITGSTNGCISSPRTVTINVTPTPTTNITASSSTICAGQTTTLTASGATTYAWLPGAQTTTIVAVTPTITTTYTVTGSSSGCSSNRTITVNVSSTPTVAASVTNTTICRGSSVNVAVTGATTYTWLPSGSGSSSVLSPTTTTIYTITGSNGSCNSTPRTVTVNVTPTPTTNISASSLSICAGQSSTLTASGATTYAWLPGAQTTTVITVTPTITTTYTVTGANGTCSSNKTITINVTPTPTVATSITNTTICSGSSIVASVTGATSYTWLPSGSGNTSTLTPASTTIYTVTGSAGSCNSSPKTFTINVTTTPTINISATSSTICAGQTVTLTASGAINYNWTPGAQTTTVIVVNPTTTTSYTVNGSSGSCSTSKTITINVNTIPTITTSITNTTICNGSSVNVALTGATSYTWLPSGSGSSSILSPTTTTIYTVTGSNGSCNSTPKNFTVNVSASPVVSSSVTNATCFGMCDATCTFVATGGTAPYAFTLIQGGPICMATNCTNLCAGIYTVNVTDANGCIGTSSILINQPPQLIATVSNTIASCSSCTDGAINSTVTGGTGSISYFWQPISVTTPSANNLPVGCYTLTVTDANNCTDIKSTCISFGTGITQTQYESSNLSIYPNPSNGLFTISNTINTGNFEVSILNTIGQTVLIESAKNANQLSFDLSKMSKGIYYAKVTNDDGSQLFKLILE